MIAELAGRLTGMALRVPVSDVSVIDLTCGTRQSQQLRRICDTIRAADGPRRGVVAYTDEQVVSTDVRGEERTCDSTRRPASSLIRPSSSSSLVRHRLGGCSVKLLDLAALTARHSAGVR